MCIADFSVKMFKIQTVLSKGHARSGERHHVFDFVPYQPLFLDYRIWESPLLQAAKENNLAAIRKLLTDGTCDIYQRGNWNYLRKMVFCGRQVLSTMTSLLVF